MLSEEMEKDGIDEDEWPTEAQIKWQNKQSRPKETGEFNNPLSKILITFLLYLFLMFFFLSMQHFKFSHGDLNCWQ